MKSTYPNNSIVYLGQLEWAEAIDKASELGLVIPNCHVAKDIQDFIIKVSYNGRTEKIMTSTTFRWDTSVFVDAVGGNEYGKDNLNEAVSGSVEGFKAKNTTPKNTKRKTYAVTKDFQIHANPVFYDYTILKHLK